MRLFEFTIRPTSGFGTPLKGDTLFGHFCWQAAYDSSLLDGGLVEHIESYGQSPFAVFSSAWPRFGDAKPVYAMKRPDLPMHRLFPAGKEESRKELMERRKERMAKKWMLVGASLSFDIQSIQLVAECRLSEMATVERTSAITDHFLSNRKRYTSEFNQPHNSINRLTMSTGDAPFAPFSEGCTFFIPGAQLAIFVLVDDKVTDASRVRRALERIGHLGFGKDSSTGRGRFEVTNHSELPLPNMPSADACYVLGPTVPERNAFTQSFFSPFIRFGKHGDRFARSRNPFKNPIVMADEGAVFVPGNRDTFRTPYIGRAVHGISLSEKKTVAQGYSIYLPVKIGDLT